MQVKATRSKQCNSYYCHVRRSHRAAYTREHIDFIAAYLVPRDIWYIIPLEIAGTDMIVLSPDLATSKHAAYKEAWHLLRGGEETGVDIDACAAEIGEPEGIKPVFLLT